GELNKNKNHETIIKAISIINDPNIHYLIIGIGELKKYLVELVEKLNLESNVHFLGYNTNVEDYYHSSDVFAFPSKREGLGLAAIEAMASGLPLITSNCRGINEYSVNEKTGFVCHYDDINCFKKSILEIK